MPDLSYSELPVFIGGPVGADTLHFIHCVPDKIEDGIEIRIERKNHADIYAQIPGMHLFGGNAMPMTKDGVEPYARRMIIFQCDKYQAPDGYNQRFVSDAFLANGKGIMRRAIEGLLDLCTSGGHFMNPASAKARMQEWKDANADIVEQFVMDIQSGEINIQDKNTHVLLGEKDILERKVMWDLFTSWKGQNCPEVRTMGKHWLYRRLDQVGIKATKLDGVWYFSGFKRCVGPGAHH